MKVKVKEVINEDVKYLALMIACPGCAELFENDGILVLPVNSPKKNPNWTWDHDVDQPNLAPSILTDGRTKDGRDVICHSHLRNGVFEFLEDSTHSMAGQNIPMLDLPEWVIKEG